MLIVMNRSIAETFINCRIEDFPEMWDFSSLLISILSKLISQNQWRKFPLQSSQYFKVWYHSAKYQTYAFSSISAKLTAVFNLMLIISQLLLPSPLRRRCNLHSRSYRSLTWRLVERMRGTSIFLVSYIILWRLLRWGFSFIVEKRWLLARCRSICNR